MFTRHASAWVLGAIALVGMGLAYAPAADIAKDNASADAKALVSAANKSYAEALERLKNGHATNSEDCYVWSRRIMDAESRADRGNIVAPYNAAKSHEKRMQELDRVWRNLVKAALAPNQSTVLTEYYLLEAKAIASDASHG